MVLNPGYSSLPADVLWASFVTHSFRGEEMNACRKNPKGRLRGGYGYCQLSRNVMVVCQLSRDVISYFIDYDFYQQTLSQFLLSFSLMQESMTVMQIPGM